MTVAAARYGIAARRYEGLWKAIVGSMVVHVALVGTLAGLMLFEPPKLDLAKKPVSAKLVRLGEKRDEHLLPRKEVRPPAPPQAKPVPAPSKPQPPRPATHQPPRAVSIFDKVNKPTSIFDRVEAKPATVFDKLEGSPQGSPEGDAAQAEGEQYYALLEARIRRFFRVGGVPESDLAKLRSILELKLDARGGVLHVEVVTSSGNAVYDAEVVSAVKRAAPFGAAPEHLKKELAGGVTVEFRFKNSGQ